MLDTKLNGKKMLFRVGAAILLLCAVLSIASAKEQLSAVNNSISGQLIPTYVSIGAIVLLSIVFVLLVLLGYRAKERGRLDMGEMRRAIAGTFVVGFTIVVLLCITYGIYTEGVILAYIELVGIVVGFYFGSRTTAQKRVDAAVKISIEHVRFPDPEKIAITIRNGGDSEINVDKIYINEHCFETDYKFDSQTSKEIEQVCKWASETEYKIKIATVIGLTAEITVMAPKKVEC